MSAAVAATEPQVSADGSAGFDAATRFDNGQAAIHGGVLAAVLDFAVSTAVLTGIDTGTAAVAGRVSWRTRRARW